MKEVTGILALVNAGTGAGIDHVGTRGVDDDGKDVRVVDDAVLDVVPALAAIAGLPRQVPRARIDYVRICRIDRDGFNVLDLSAGFGRDALPRLSGVSRAIYAVERPCNQAVRVGSGNRH